MNPAPSIFIVGEGLIPSPFQNDQCLGVATRTQRRTWLPFLCLFVPFCGYFLSFACGSADSCYILLTW